MAELVDELTDLVARLVAALGEGDIAEAVWLNEQIGDLSVGMRGELLDEAHVRGIGWDDLARRFDEPPSRVYVAIGTAGHGPPPPAGFGENSDEPRRATPAEIVAAATAAVNGGVEELVHDAGGDIDVLFDALGLFVRDGRDGGDQLAMAERSAARQLVDAAWLTALAERMSG